MLKRVRKNWSTWWSRFTMQGKKSPPEMPHSLGEDSKDGFRMEKIKRNRKKRLRKDKDIFLISHQATALSIKPALHTV